MPVNTRCVAVLAGTALLGIGLDEVTKALVVATLEGKPPFRLIGQVLTVCVSPNSGAAFGVAPAATVLFTCHGRPTHAVFPRSRFRLPGPAGGGGDLWPAHR